MGFLRKYIIFKLVFWLFCMLPIYYSVLLVHVSILKHRYENEGIRIKGTVTDVKRELGGSDNDKLYYFPKVSYYDEEGNENTVELEKSTYWYRKNEEIELVYLPENPGLVIHNHEDSLPKPEKYISAVVIQLTAIFFVYMIVRSIINN